MKKHLKITTLLVSILTICSMKYEDSFIKMHHDIDLYKEECKQLIKPYRYESSVITYATPQKRKQFKSQIILFNPEVEYLLVFSGKACSSKLTISIHSRSADSKNQYLLLKLKRLNGKNMSITSEELNEIHQKMSRQNAPLNEIYVKYKIEKSKNHQAIICVKGSQKQKSNTHFFSDNSKF